MSERFARQVVVVVGATGGLGEAITRAFADEGATLALAARNRERLDTLAETLEAPTSVQPVDLTDPETITGLAETVLNVHDQVDTVVNATGVDVRKPLGTHTEADIDQMLAVNLGGAVRLTRAFLPALDGDGIVVHLGGFADGRLAFPYHSVDVATRAGVYSFVESMNRELAGTDMTVTYFSPNPADTEAERPFHPMWEDLGLTVVPPETVADALLDVVADRERVHLMGGWTERLFAKVNAVSPRLADLLALDRYRVTFETYLAGCE